MPTREDVIHDILDKKELRGVEHSFVSAVLDKELRKRPKIHIESLSARSSAYDELVKAVRAVLRRNVGLYEGDPRHMDALLAELRQAVNPEQRAEIITHLLSAHASTRERLPFYDRVFEQLFAITGKPLSVLDIGCGLNPLAFPWDDTRYVGVDIDRAACTVVQAFFGMEGIDGECRVLDAHGMEQISRLPKSDVAFVFKLLDLLEQKGHRVSEKLIQALPARWIVVSFSTNKISGKPMRVPRRAWFEKMLARLKLECRTFDIPNEIFYVIRKH